METLYRLYRIIFGKTIRAKIPTEEKEQIKDLLNEMISKTEAGTAKIDQQIAELTEVNRIIDKLEERAFKRDTAKKIDDAEGGLLPPVGDSSALTSMLKQLADKTGLTPVQIRRAIVDNINAGYAPNDPKRLRLDDSESLERYLQTKLQYGDEQDLIDDVIEGLYSSATDTILGSKRPKNISDEMAEDELLPFGSSGEARDDMMKKLSMPPDEFNKMIKKREGITKIPVQPKTGGLEEMLDDELKKINQEKQDLRRAEELMADINNFGKTFDEIMQMVQDEKIVPIKPKKKATGGRVQLKDGGGPKLSRRRLLQLMSAGIGGLLMPKGARKIADAMTPTVKKIVPAPGMPDWFPLLVQQIKTKGKKVREPDYADFTSGGDTTVRYELKDKSLAGDKIFLEEDMQTGTVSIFGRGDDYQQVSMDYFPGSRSVDKSGRIRETEPDFEMMEFAKGEIQDIENFGGIDEMRGDLGSWIKLSGIDKTAKNQLEEVKKLFQERTKDPTPLEPPAGSKEEFAEGGGVGSLFKRKA